jgi:hypothetical protein
VGSVREAFAVESEAEEHFSEISLDDHHDHVQHQDHVQQDPAKSPLFQRMNPSGFLSLPQSAGKRSVSYCGSSWEANKDLEEQTHGSHVLRRENVLSHLRPISRQRSIMLEELEEKCLSSIATVSQDSLR